MRVAYIQSIGGASGDMLLGALVDLGFDLESLRRELPTIWIPNPCWTRRDNISKGPSPLPTTSTNLVSERHSIVFCLAV